MKRKVPFILLVLSVGIIFYIYQSKRVYELNQMPTGGDFSFVKKGEEVSLSDFKGVPVVLYFGFTFCPDVCPTMLSTLKGIKRQIKDFQVIFITVDPERDTQKKIDDYVNFFDSSFIALRGSVEKTRNVAKMYGVNFKKFYPSKESKNYVIDHTTYALLIDKNGKLVDFLPHGEQASVIESTIKKYL